MREAIGGTALFQIVIFFIMLFTGFMCLSINQSKAFNVKDQIIQTIQSYNGIDLESQYEDGQVGAMADIVSYLSDNAYRTTGNCPGPIELNGQKFEYQGYTKDGKITSSHAAFCIAKVESGNAIMNQSCSGDGCITSELPDMAYYRIVVFYQLDLPIFHELFNFTIYGDTKTLFIGSEES